jgi:hypothetical protein
MDTLTLRSNVKLGLTFPLPFEKSSSPCDIRNSVAGNIPECLRCEIVCLSGGILFYRLWRMV